MYFKKLELVGFKSFYNKTTLDFEPGTTAIVGPNGCGKSNILDGIRWVLGEQSVKSLRGCDMQDVIFNGTDLKEPLGMAEVTLTFDNENKFFNFEHKEMAITRRLFRSGESEYLLNKAPVRLKDIQDILMGTGVGAESYSIVAQGKIDLVLSSRPEDRRLIFDEASGITRYKAQKKETARKLEETEQNLLRINDIVAEVKRQIASLERQANKARKYKEIFEELKTKEINLAGLEKNALLKQKDAIINQLLELGAKEAQLLETIREQELKITNRQTELKKSENEMLDLRNQLLGYENLIARNKEHINFHKERIHELAESEIFLTEQLKQIRSKLIQDEEKLNSIKAEYDAIKKNTEDKTGILKEKDGEINCLDLTIKESLENISRAKKLIFEAASKIANTKNEIVEFNSGRQVYLSRKKRLEIDKAKSFQEKAIAEQGLNNVTQEALNLKNTVEETNLKISTVKNDLKEQNDFLNKTNSDIESLERQRLTLESHKEFLEKLKTKYDDIVDSSEAVVYLNQLPPEKVSGLVVKIRDYVDLNDEDKIKFSPASFKLSGEAKPIELDTQKIDEKISCLLDEVSLLKNKKLLIEGRVEELNKAISSLQQELRNQEISLSNKETSRLTTLGEFNKLKEEEDLIVMDLQDTEREISVLETNLVTSQTHLATLEKARFEHEDSILKEEDNICGNNKLRELVLITITQIKTELDVLAKRVASDEETIRIIENTYKHDLENADSLEKQLNDNYEKRKTLQQEIRECETKIEEFTNLIQNQNTCLKELEVKYENASISAIEVVKKIETDRKELDLLKNQLHDLRLEDNSIDYKYTGLKERMQQAYRIDLDGGEQVPATEELNTDALSEEITGLKQRLDSCGQVNLVAIQEYDELKQRYDFLIQQQTDLLNAKESLRQAILKINRTTKQLFLETFEKVKKEFRDYFRMLFNGGDAQIYLTDEHDPLESGIEIIARPPGKKLQNILLLSGGEKSLSAVALIFAIFRVKPSPFCILDEIDAALDEANVDRFSRVMLESAKESQFIVITHNKKTIANADAMYGITMEQSGISKIVSVKFAQNKPENSSLASSDQNQDSPIKNNEPTVSPQDEPQEALLEPT